MSKQVWIVIAAYNEAEVISAVVEPLLRGGYHVVVVDDHSRDETAARALRAGAHVLSHPVNLGQGAALQTGIRYALAHGAAYLVTYDADGQHVPDEVPKLLAPLLAAECDVALSTRFAAGGTAVNIPAAKRTLLRLATAFTRMTTKLEVTDTHNGFRAFSAAAAKQLDITQNRMAHASQILMQIHEHGLRYKEIPVRILYTDYSMSKGQRMSNAFNIVWESLMQSLGL